MKMVKSLLLGSAAGVAAIAGAQAADLPVKAKPVEYVKVCSLYGAGYYYIPGTETCIRIGGFLRLNLGFDRGGTYTPIYTGAGSPALQRDRNFINSSTRLATQIDIRSNSLAKIRDFVHERYPRSEERIGRVLDHFCGPDVDHLNGTSGPDKWRIDFLKKVDRPCAAGAQNDSVRPHEVIDCGALFEEFRVGNHVK